MERFVKIIQKGTNSSKSSKTVIKIDKIEVANNHQILNTNQEMKDNKTSKEQDDYLSSINNNNDKISNKKVIFNLNSEVNIIKLEKLSICENPKKVKKADTSLNVPLMKLNGNLNPFYLPIIGKQSMNFSKNDIIFCQIVDGIKPDISFEALVFRFCDENKNNKTLFVYIYPDDLEDLTNDKQFKKENIFSNYSDNYRRLDEDRFFFLSEEKDMKSNENKFFKQSLGLIKDIKISYLFASFEGLAGPKKNQKEFESNIKYLLKYVDIPTILFKESIFLNIEAKEKEKSKFNWLFIFDMNDSRCYSILGKFIGLIDQINDSVSAITFLPPTLKKDDIELNFLNEMKLRKVKNYSYQMINIKEPFKYVIDLVNNGEIHYNFVVIYNKIKLCMNSSIKSEKNTNNNINIIKECLSNICIYSGL